MVFLLISYEGFRGFFLEGWVSIHKRVFVVAGCFIFLFRAQPFDFTKCILTYFYHFFSPTVCALSQIALSKFSAGW